MNVRAHSVFLSMLVFSVGVGSTAAAAGGVAEPKTSADLRFDFALIGDVPYDALQTTNLFPNMIEELNRARLAFVVHDGDIKSGSTPCTDEWFHRSYTQFQTIRHPFVLLFGDNEWTDCGGVQTNSFEPAERLQKLREIFTQGGKSLGQRQMTLARQSDSPGFGLFRENVRWVYGRVVFAGLNVPGNRNNFGTPEFGPRNEANIAWIKETFAIAQADNLRAVMLMMQANPHFDLGATNRLRQGFNEMLKVIEAETVAFKKPVVLVHGDSHYFRIDQPLISSRSRRRIENFTRVETFGNPDVHWIRVSVDWRDPNVFRFHPEYVKKNLLKHD